MTCQDKDPPAQAESRIDLNFSASAVLIPQPKYSRSQRSLQLHEPLCSGHTRQHVQYMTIVVPCKMTVRIAVCLLHQQGCACRKRAVESSTRDGICHLLQLGRGSRLDIGMGQPGGCLPCGLCKCRTQLVQLFHGITHASQGSAQQIQQAWLPGESTIAQAQRGT